MRIFSFNYTLIGIRNIQIFHSHLSSASNFSVCKKILFVEEFFNGQERMKVNKEKCSEKIPEKMEIREGSASIVSEGHVFYNPVQEFNRDLSVLVLSTFSRLFWEESVARSGDEDEFAGVAGTKCDKGMRILEALAATGLRSIRYAKEVPGIREIIANDLSRKAVQDIRENVERNGVKELVTPHEEDALMVMYTNMRPQKRFTVIDLDPYGCPTRFLDAAVQSVMDGGMLLVTATDMAVLAGNSPESCYVKYGAISLKSRACHEMAIRILLKSIESHATQYGRFIKPMLSISADFYIRVFVRIFTSPVQCKKSTSKQSHVFQCTGCESFTLQPLGVLKPNPTEKNPTQVKYALPTGPSVDSTCTHCGFRHHLGGPIWSDPIHDAAFVDKLLDNLQEAPYSNLGTSRRLLGQLTVIQEELPDVPLYYSVDKLCSTIRVVTMPVLKFRSALLHAGYRVSYSHAHKNSLKTDAPNRVLWDILRCWAEKNPINPERLQEGTPVKAILAEKSQNSYEFDIVHPQANPESRRNCLSRFPENPTANWGPGTRATLMIGGTTMTKSVRNQNKTKRRREDDKDPVQDLKVLKNS
ncbi:tRNA (guanine(26)-N(2))-dimethyltransferase [Lutzomyia longipalpis]|uniref:tRNA (guanine(26)-N(2))-dimethyltransferase n=1 Tax=Lutzomyia longipalpis TaxID=7200 RepID=UPI0024845981|nr:tRNA (guanine(26)-N(2))-dimethyltransferase [Lutzomyia longipalpis]